jgi:hypothetical protein
MLIMSYKSTELWAVSGIINHEKDIHKRNFHTKFKSIYSHWSIGANAHNKRQLHLPG